MKYADQKEIDALATEFIARKTKVQKTKSKQVKRKFKAFQNYCVDQFKFLVTNKIGKYRKFSNSKDLEQDGYEALVLALRTYNPSKGSFSWWADKYIQTRISRAANAHSTIRFPLKKARDLKPFKTSTIPVIIDSQPSAIEIIEQTEQAKSVLDAVSGLPEQHQQLINLVYGFGGKKPQSIGNAIKVLQISRPQCLRILEEAKEKLKEKLTETIEENV